METGGKTPGSTKTLVYWGANENKGLDLSFVYINPLPFSPVPPSTLPSLTKEKRNTNKRSSKNKAQKATLMAATCMSNIFYCDTIEYDSEPNYYLDSCSLCKKPLSKNRDIFMYRGDAPFCSEECRQEQMEIDQEKEFRRNHAKRASSSKKGRRELRQRQEEEVY
ncbi:hypothetical protein LUZ62_069521 [Rhynchospora pubera]|uniref:FLZ-type domain-containing protein n=1 Tax=Rhynchospora pubera TaxID=906938 RepID=A0AAV8CXW0_9POAL|nr:hypothetical protein LUZ62_069521 [Rhynchospora pubera]